MLSFALDQVSADTLQPLAAAGGGTVFDPAGYVGLAYWYLLCPVHQVVFGWMLQGIVEQLRTELGDDAFGRQHDVGRAMSPDDAIRFALEAIARASQHLLVHPDGPPLSNR